MRAPLCTHENGSGPIVRSAWRVDLHRPQVQTARRCRRVRQYTPPESPTHVQRQ